MYSISLPMPFKKDHIDELIQLNKNIELSQITDLYFALPADCTDICGFEQPRVVFGEVTNFDYWAELISYTLEKEFSFTYLLNSPRSFMPEFEILGIQLEKLDKLLNNLRKLGCNRLRVANTQLMGYLIKNYPDFNVLGSTSLEYTQMKQYTAFFSIFKEVKEIVPSWSINRNFPLLKNLRKAFPNIEFELMINEGCTAGCPLRYHHNLSLPSFHTDIISTYPRECTPAYFTEKCFMHNNANFFENICKSNTIYPWQLSEYSKLLGINKFKLTGRNSSKFGKGTYIEVYKKYLKGIDDYKNIENEEYKILNHYILASNLSIKVKDIKPYLPDIKHFIKNGHLCDSSCGVTCRYCYKLAEKLSKKLM